MIHLNLVQYILVQHLRFAFLVRGAELELLSADLAWAGIELRRLVGTEFWRIRIPLALLESRGILVQPIARGHADC